MTTVLITGSEGQLGQCFIKRFLALDYKVIAFDIKNSKQIKQVNYFKVDITKKQQVETALKHIECVDILINNAGAQVFTDFTERTEDELDFVINVNLKGTIFMIQGVFNMFMKHKKKGCIINVGSHYGVVSGDMRLYSKGDRKTSEIYGATKAGVIHLSKYLATYMAPYNVRVNCISPGGIFNHQDEVFVKKYSAKVPLNRMGNENELLSTIEYLMSEDSSYVTGQNIIVDGGFTSW